MPIFNSVFFDIGDTLVTAGAWVEGAKATLQQLKSSGVGFGLISNTGDFSRDELQYLLPSDFSFGDFDDVLFILSREVGQEKPPSKNPIHRPRLNWTNRNQRQTLRISNRRLRMERKNEVGCDRLILTGARSIIFAAL